MTTENDRQPRDHGVYPSRTRRRGRIAIGAAGAAVVLGASAYVITDQAMGGSESTTAQHTGAIAPATPPGTAEPSVTSTGSAPTPTSGASSAQPSRTPVSIPPSVKAEIDRARVLAAKEGHPVQRPVTPAPGVTPFAGTVKQRDERTDEGTIRVLSAKHDLTGQRELLLAADQGREVGDARCTQKVRFSAGARAREIPTLLLCWRTSAARSVVTMAVAKAGNPSAAESVAVIDKEWVRLG